MAGITPLMRHPSDRPFSNADSALARLRGAQDLDAAEDAWVDFLHYWVRAISKHDAHTAAYAGSGSVKFSHALKTDSCLHYLWQARNTDEHTIGDVAGRTEDSTAFVPIMDLVDGLALTADGWGIAIDVGADGWGLQFRPAELHLVPVTNRNGTFEPPLGPDGFPMKPLQLAEYGLDVLRRVLRPPDE